MGARDVQGNLTLQGERKRRNTGPQSQAPNLDILSSALDDKTPTIRSFPETRRFLARSAHTHHLVALQRSGSPGSSTDACSAIHGGQGVPSSGLRIDSIGRTPQNAPCCRQEEVSRGYQVAVEVVGAPGVHTCRQTKGGGLVTNCFMSLKV